MLRNFVLVIVCLVSSVGAAFAGSKAPRAGVVSLPSGVQVRYVERGAVAS